MQSLNAERTTVYLTKDDRIKIETIKKKENSGARLQLCCAGQSMRFLK